MTERILFAATRIGTFLGDQALTNATGFFFRRDKRLFLVSSRHVVVDAAANHFPDRLELVLHVDAVDLTRLASVYVPLYRDGKSLWRQGRDSGGDIDVATLEIDEAMLPPRVVLEAFTPEHLQLTDQVEFGQPLLLVAYPLGFYDTLHALPVARQAVVASAFGVRFQGQGLFLTDARMHRGASGAPVLMRSSGSGGTLPWKLLGVHSSRMDMKTRDLVLDESLGLNSAWYADILMTLTSEQPPTAEEPPASAPPVG
jgi:hypothetical protein